MRILKRANNEVKLRVESPEDLWAMANVISKGDMACGNIRWKSDRGEDLQRSKKGEVKRIRVCIRVKNIDFQEFSDRLRVSGSVISGPEDVIDRHVSLNIGVDEEISLIKVKWSREMLDMLKEAEKESKKPKIVLVGVDREGVWVYSMLTYGLKKVGESSVSGGGKYSPEDVEAVILKDVLEIITPLLEGDVEIVVYGPGFTYESVAKKLKEKLGRNVYAVNTGHADERGVHEVIRGGGIRNLMDSRRLAEEQKEMEKLLAEIKKEDGLGDYGIKAVKAYLDKGAVDMLLITDELFRTNDGQRVVGLAAETGAKYIILSTAHEWGKMLKSLGGAGALLRYKS